MTPMVLGPIPRGSKAGVIGPSAAVDSQIPHEDSSTRGQEYSRRDHFGISEDCDQWYVFRSFVYGGEG